MGCPGLCPVCPLVDEANGFSLATLAAELRRVGGHYEGEGADRRPAQREGPGEPKGAGGFVFPVPITLRAHWGVTVRGQVPRGRPCSAWSRHPVPIRAAEPAPAKPMERREPRQRPRAPEGGAQVLVRNTPILSSVITLI